MKRRDFLSILPAALLPPMPPKLAPKQPEHGGRTLMRLASRRVSAAVVPSGMFHPMTQQGFAISGLAISDNHVLLVWTGGTAPFQVEEHADLGWRVVTETLSSQAVLPLRGQGLFRVKQQAYTIGVNGQTISWTAPELN